MNSALTPELQASATTYSAEVQRLQRRVEYLEAELALYKTSTRDNYDIAHAFGLTLSEGKMLSRILVSGSATVAQIELALYGVDAGEKKNATEIIRQFAFRLKRKLAAHGIALCTRWGVGWFIEPDDLLRLRETLRVYRESRL